MDRSLDTGVGLKASAKQDEVSLCKQHFFFAGMKKAAEQQAIPVLIDPKSARGSAKKNKAVGSDGASSSSTSCPSKAIFAQDGHRPSDHCIKTPTRPQAQLKTVTTRNPNHNFNPNLDLSLIHI